MLSWGARGTRTVAVAGHAHLDLVFGGTCVCVPARKESEGNNLADRLETQTTTSMMRLHRQSIPVDITPTTQACYTHRSCSAPRGTSCRSRPQSLGVRKAKAVS